jgi:hypothetical protein
MMQSPEAVARESIEAIIDGRLEVIRGGADRKEMVKLNRNDPITIDDVLRPMRASMEEASGITPLCESAGLHRDRYAVS